jgi:voltage-gated potassium channel Kch
MKSLFLRPFLRHIAQKRFFYLLIAILTFIIGNPFIKDPLPMQFHFLTDLFITIIFITATYALSEKKRQLTISILLAAPLLILTWAKYVIDNFYIDIIGYIFVALFLGYIVICLADFIFEQKEVTKDVIAAALIIFLLIALVWTFVYAVLDAVYPGSFSFGAKPHSDVYHFVYFSFVTLTTLGYGDIVPLTERARALVIMEAVVGQIYLVVGVAWLVGMHVSRRSR